MFQAENIGHILGDCYRYLQKTAIGLEQIVIDKDKEDSLYANFSESRNWLRLVLTEVQNAIFDHDMYSISEDNLRMDIIPNGFRSLNNNVTLQTMRDGIIFITYINTLDYVRQVSEHLKNQLQSS